MSGAGVAFWRVEPPARWPEPPTEMSVSALRELEACPRRWALSTAEYPALWRGWGYPRKVNLASLIGSVLHLSLQTLTRSATTSGCTSVRDAQFVELLKRLGGYTQLLRKVIDEVIEPLKENPRAKGSLDLTRQTLTSRLPELRVRVQGLISQWEFPRHGPTGRSGSASRRTSLLPGVHTEVLLRARVIGWKGTVDMLFLAADRCELIEVKSGETDPSHRFQLQVYALLWTRDSEANPNGRRADALTLRYPSEKEAIEPPTDAQLRTLEDDLVARSASARHAIERGVPPARRDIEGCARCGVRHLCDEYWEPWQPVSLSDDSPVGQFADMELRVTDRRGPASVAGVVVNAPGIPRGQLVLVRLAVHESRFVVGNVVRVLDAHLLRDTEVREGPLVVTLTAVSEAYVVAGS